MRNLFLLLLAANLIFAGWQYFVRSEFPQPGVERVDWNAPEIEPVAQPVADETVDPESVMPEPGSESVDSPEAAAVAPSYAARCASVGPFETDADARAEQSVLEGQGLTPASRSKNGQVFSGRWVYVDNVRNRAESDQLLRRLQSGGLEEAYRLPDEESGGYVISLGVFSTDNGAKTVTDRAESLGFEVTIEPRYRDVPEYWLDVQLDSEDAEQLVLAAFGESLVVFSDSTTCHQ